MEVRRYEVTGQDKETGDIWARDVVELRLSVREAVQLVVDLSSIAKKAGIEMKLPPDNQGAMSAARILFRMAGASCKKEIEDLAKGMVVRDRYGAVKFSANDIGKEAEMDENVCVKSENGKHVPEWMSARPADFDPSILPDRVIDVPCRMCGTSGSFVVKAEEVRW